MIVACLTLLFVSRRRHKKDDFNFIDYSNTPFEPIHIKDYGYSTFIVTMNLLINYRIDYKYSHPMDTDQGCYFPFSVSGKLFPILNRIHVLQVFRRLRY